jgi:hypothetical protein
MDFSIVDFFIGLTLANALPHFALGVWKGRMLSAFGFGNFKNILYSFANLGIAVGLACWKYGTEILWENQIILGALVCIIGFYVVGPFCYRIFHVQNKEVF